MSKFVTNQYLNTKDILRVADHYVAIPVTVSDDGITLENGKKIVPAGTIIGGKSQPRLVNENELVEAKNTNGALTGATGSPVDAEGVLLSDVDVTHGPNAGAMVIHGFIKLSKLPEVPEAEAIKALKQITFTA